MMQATALWLLLNHFKWCNFRSEAGHLTIFFEFSILGSPHLEYTSR